MTRIWFGDTTPIAPGWVQITTDRGVPALLEAIGRATLVWIDDPLAFPWDSVGDSLSVPVDINAKGLSLLDLAALTPWLETLGPGDLIMADQAVQPHLTNRYGTASGSAADEQFTTSELITERAAAKSIHCDQRDIVARLRHEATARGDADRVIIKTLDREAIVESPTSGNFNETVAAVMAGHGPGSAIEVWGLRSRPGAELAGAVIAYRLADIEDEDGYEQ